MKIVDRFECFLFDWDGCLADTLIIWMGEYQKQFAKRNLFPSESEIASIFGDYEGPCKLGATDNKEFVAQLFADVETSLPLVKLHTNALETLKRLKASNKKIAILTSSKRNSVWSIIQKFEVDKYIDLFLGGEDVTKHKPDPEIVYKALEKLGCQKKQTIIIGDSDKDILSGKAAGIFTAVYYPEVNHKYYKESELKNLAPDFFITDFQELL